MDDLDIKAFYISSAQSVALINLVRPCSVLLVGSLATILKLAPPGLFVFLHGK